MEVLQLYVTPDRNGNSRILFLAIVDGAIVDGYDPDDDWIKPEWAKRLSVQVTVSAKEYKITKRMADAIRTLNPCGYVEPKGSSARGRQR
jgi:hypothetical protein